MQNSFLRIIFIPVKSGEKDNKPADLIVKRPVAQESAEPQESVMNQALLGNAPIAWELFTVSVTTAEHNSAAIIKIKALL